MSAVWNCAKDTPAASVRASIIAARSTNCSVLTREVLMDGCFSQDYVEAREKFAAAARAAGAEVTGFALDKRGPDGGKLSTDVAWLGPPDARRVLVTISGTHGVEGFFGSATQIEWLRRAKTAPPPAGIAALHIRAILPYG